jgi:ketosteroid isomerase-like protein
MSSLPERLKEFYETFTTEREAALARLPEFFTEDIHFKDPFRESHGMAAFNELFVRMFRQYRLVRFSNFSLQGDEKAFVLSYDMHLRMVVGPTFVTQMVSVCQVRDGRISELTDYYDFTSTLASPLPFLKALYRKTINTLFL